MRWNAPEDFQSYPPVRVSARNCLMWNTRLPTASCAGVCWNNQECAGVGHNLGTNRSGSYWISSFARPAGTPTAGRACQSPLAESYWVAVAPTRAALDGARRARSPGVTCDTGVRPAHRVRSVRCRRLDTAPAPARISLRRWRRRRRAEGRLRGAQLYRASWLSPPLAPPGLSEETVGAHGRVRSWLKCAVTV